MKDLRLKPYPGYERNVSNNIGFGSAPSITMAEMQAQIRGYKLAEGTTMKDIYIPGPEEGQELMLHIITPGNLPEKAPMIMDIHGGGWVSGDVGIDNYRNVHLAEHTPAIVVAVEYRLASKEVPFPGPLMDCYCALNWMHDHAEEIGGDPENIAIHGTSAGGNMVAGLMLYVRDFGGPDIKLAIMNCPSLYMEETPSRRTFGNIGTPKKVPGSQNAFAVYAGSCDPKDVSMYACPGHAPSLVGCPPCMIIVGEYDPLRDDGLKFGMRLLEDHVPTEIICAPRVSHGFCTVDQPLTHWVHNACCASLRREFGMEIGEYK